MKVYESHASLPSLVQRFFADWLIAQREASPHIVRYGRPPRGRLLGADDLAKLGAILRQREAESPACVAAVRLLLLTGCRPGEIRCLRWCEVKPDRLALIDAKRGPRRALLGQAARELLDGLAGTASGEWVFPGYKGNGPLSTGDLWRSLDQDARRGRDRSGCAVA